MWWMLRGQTTSKSHETYRKIQCGRDTMHGQSGLQSLGLELVILEIAMN